MRSPQHLIVAVLALLIVFGLPAAALGQQGAVVAIQPPASSPAVEATFTTDVTITGASGVLGFQFDINFDPAVLAVESVELGPFLSSTGRSARPLGPDQRAAAEGRVVYGGFTLGNQEGAGGDGVLATITWRALKEGESQVSLSKLQLAGDGGMALPGSVGDSIVIAVGGAVSGAPGGGEATGGEADQSSQPVGGIPIWVWAVVAVVVIALAGLIVVRGGAADKSGE